MTTITLSQAVQVLTGRAGYGEQCGWATTDFCDAVSKITGNTQPGVLQGCAGAMLETAPQAKSQLTGMYADLAKAVENEIDFDSKTGEESAQAMTTWTAKNKDRFSDTLFVGPTK